MKDSPAANVDLVRNANDCDAHIRYSYLLDLRRVLFLLRLSAILFELGECIIITRCNPPLNRSFRKVTGS